MEFSKYARIGKSPLIKAIGVQKNHKETFYIESQELDYAASGCFACPNYKNIEFYEYMPEAVQKQTDSCCNECPHAKYKTVTHEKIRYINEKNMYGSSPRLKSIALKLLVIYHFKNPDDRGYIKSLSPKELAAELNCTVRSIKNANLKLQEYGYIMYCHDGFSKNRFHIILPEYDSYALTADQGGRGYATFNLPFLKEVLRIKDLNQLRIFLRTALDLDTNRNPERELIKETPYSFLRSFLPHYCKPNIIRKALSAVTGIFQVSCEDETIYMKMEPEYHGRRDFEKSSKLNTDIIRTYLENLDAVIKRANNSIRKNKHITKNDSEYLSQAGIKSQAGLKNKKFYVPFKLHEDDYKDLGILASTYTCDSVIGYIGYVYEAYSAKFKISSIGALIRTILRSNAVDTCFLAASI